VHAPAVEADDGGPLGKAARAVADAVTGLLGTPSPDAPAGEGSRPAAAGLRDVLTALAGAASAWRDRREERPAGAARKAAGDGAGRSPAAFLGDLLAAVGPRLPIRDAARLRQAHPGASDDEIAEALIVRAGRLTAGVGAATGGLSAAQWLAPPSLIALPLGLGAEAVLTAAVEVVLLGELHELYGQPAAGDDRERAAAYLASWSEQRSVAGEAATAGLVAVLGSAGLRALRRRMSRRLARSVPSAAPFLLGAALAGRGNRKATEAVARRVLGDLRRRRVNGSGDDHG
jgi:hypothetical protein